MLAPQFGVLRAKGDVHVFLRIDFVIVEHVGLDLPAFAQVFRVTVAVGADGFARSMPPDGDGLPGPLRILLQRNETLPDEVPRRRNACHFA